MDEPRRRREHVVGRLSHVDVIVGVDARVGALRLAEDLAGAVGEHLVGVHVVRRAGARLVHVDDELIAKLAGQDLVGGLDDGVGDGRRRGAPSAPLARAHACLMSTVAVTSGAGAFSPLIGKFSTARCVCTP